MQASPRVSSIDQALVDVHQEGQIVVVKQPVDPLEEAKVDIQQDLKHSHQEVKDERSILVNMKRANLDPH